MTISQAAGGSNARGRQTRLRGLQCNRAANALRTQVKKKKEGKKEKKEKEGERKKEGKNEMQHPTRCMQVNTHANIHAACSQIPMQHTACSKIYAACS